MKHKTVKAAPKRLSQNGVAGVQTAHVKIERADRLCARYLFYALYLPIDAAFRERKIAEISRWIMRQRALKPMSLRDLVEGWGREKAGEIAVHAAVAGTAEQSSERERNIQKAFATCMTEKGTVTAERQNLQPIVVSMEDIRDALDSRRSALNRLPFLGRYCHTGWRRVRVPGARGQRNRGQCAGNAGCGAWLVDATGKGTKDEPALTFDELAERIVPGFGYGMVECGKYQIKVGMFERKKEA